MPSSMRCSTPASTWRRPHSKPASSRRSMTMQWSMRRWRRPARHLPRCARPLAKVLLEQGARLSFHDPLVKNWSVAGHDLTSVDELPSAVQQADLCIVLQNHRQYDVDALAALSRRFLDTRGTATRADNVQRL